MIYAKLDILSSANNKLEFFKNIHILKCLTICENTMSVLLEDILLVLMFFPRRKMKYLYLSLNNYQHQLSTTFSQYLKKLLEPMNVSLDVNEIKRRIRRLPNWEFSGRHMSIEHFFISNHFNL